MNSKNVEVMVDVLGTGVDNIDRLYQWVQKILSANSYGLDMDNVTFVKPYGFIGLVLVARIFGTAIRKSIGFIQFTLCNPSVFPSHEYS